jgi:hypothetical protein
MKETRCVGKQVRMYMWEGYRRHTGPEFIAARGAVELSSRCDILLLAHEGRASLMSE